MSSANVNKARRATVTAADHRLLGLIAGKGALARKLDRARIVPGNEVPHDVVTMNSRVHIIDAGVHRRVKLVHPHEGDGRGRVSVLSALGTALLGLSAGAEAECDFPGGAPRRIRVEKVIAQPERTP